MSELLLGHQDTSYSPLSVIQVLGCQMFEFTFD